MKYTKGIPRAGLATVAAVIAVGGAGLATVLLPAHKAAAACTAPASTYGTATTTITVAEAGTYNVWSRLMAPDTTNNAFMLEIDGAACYTVGNAGITPSTWTWVNYQNGSTASKINVSLTKGLHTLKLIGTEPNVKIDRVLAVSDIACVPTGMGDNCTTQADTTAPAAVIVTPAEGEVISGPYTVTATATDAKGVNKVEFYVNGMLNATDTTLPYAFSWPAGTLANGSYTLGVKAYDVAGNVGSDTATVQIRNGDTQAPGAPTALTAKATAFNSVALSWKASTDNTAVTGYVLTRDGAPLATLDAVTAYTDTSVIGGKTYVYRVSARDAAGNVSALSPAVSVTTPTAPTSDTQAPTAPAQLTGAAASTSQINLTWQPSTDNTGVAGYDIYRAGIGGTPAKIITVTTPGFSDTALKSGAQYAYYVIAKDAKGNASAPSATVRVTTASPPTEQPSDPTTPVVRAGMLRGKVTGRRDKGLAQVHVTVWSDGKRYTATTNGRGVYRIDDLPKGRYEIKFAVSGYHTERDDLRIREGKDTIKNTRLDQTGRNNWWNRWWR